MRLHVSDIKIKMLETHVIAQFRKKPFQCSLTSMNCKRHEFYITTPKQ